MEKTRFYFVDEAGDLNLFNKKGKIIVGKQGVSNFFMVGVAWIQNPEQFTCDLEKLRKKLMADSYFSGVASMRPESRKTALYFHATDDLPEVRREVFELLRISNILVQAVVFPKMPLANYAKNDVQAEGGKFSHKSYRVFYDVSAFLCFYRLLSLKYYNSIIFARKGKAQQAQGFIDSMNLSLGPPAMDKAKHFTVTSEHPSNHAGLQAIDYFLWALQRMFEKYEDRFYHFIAEHFRNIFYIEDWSNQRNRHQFTRENPLTLEMIKKKCPRAD